MEGLKRSQNRSAHNGARHLLTKGGTRMATIKDGSQPAPCGEGFDHDLVHELR